MLFRSVPTTPGGNHFRVQARVAGVGWTDLVRYDLGVLPVLPGGDLTGWAVAAAYSGTLIADPTGIDRFVLTADSVLPAGLSLDEATGTVAGTPTAAGAFTFRARARVAGVGHSDAQTYRVLVAPVLTGGTLPSGRAGSPVSVRLGDPATGIDRFALAAGSSLPPGLHLDSATGVLSGTPTAAGTFSFAVLAVNDEAGSSAPTEFTLVLAADSGLAATGADVRTGLLAALALLGVGGALVVVRRRSAARG